MDALDFQLAALLEIQCIQIVRPTKISLEDRLDRIISYDPSII